MFKIYFLNVRTRYEITLLQMWEGVKYLVLEKFEKTKVSPEDFNPSRTNKTMTIWKKYKSKLRIEQHEPH